MKKILLLLLPILFIYGCATSKGESHLVATPVTPKESAIGLSKQSPGDLVNELNMIKNYNKE